ncbi:MULTISPECIES: group III truncated hemoglobin [unclassified Polaribacter]|uniref:group III truncated hemoglobin n=1 Tax=unclassified Polaribacter TaxID=196858 RepID=UPI0011BED51F|nr:MULTISPECIES: group III truncated hemoglobin [unclassified Polaribacter]TXD51286.1 group III truncated hemoglobin [Polaribacter sp. IC063]TXD58039.1 group III truncated hemoglobin [Polaribacter sp. IC066]
MTPDISSRKDIKLIMTKFYDLLLLDEKMFPFFEEIVKENQLEHHLEIITDFWNDILFDTAIYQNNVMQKHLNKNAFVAFKKEHFTIWISYFSSTIDAFFKGENSERMKARAASIATIMQLKMNLY